MNTNRSDKLGTLKALRRFGSRRGLAPYQAIQEARAHKKLVSMVSSPVRRAAEMLKHLAKTTNGAMPEIGELLSFVRFGPFEAPQICRENPWYDCPGKAKVGNVGVSVQDLADLAQQYKYLHPEGPKAPREYNELSLHHPDFDK